MRYKGVNFSVCNKDNIYWASTEDSNEIAGSRADSESVTVMKTAMILDNMLAGYKVTKPRVGDKIGDDYTVVDVIERDNNLTVIFDNNNNVDVITRNYILVSDDKLLVPYTNVRLKDKSVIMGSVKHDHWAILEDDVIMVEVYGKKMPYDIFKWKMIYEKEETSLQRPNN